MKSNGSITMFSRACHLSLPWARSGVSGGGGPNIYIILLFVNALHFSGEWLAHCPTPSSGRITLASSPQLLIQYSTVTLHIWTWSPPSATSGCAMPVTGCLNHWELSLIFPICPIHVCPAWFDHRQDHIYDRNVTPYTVK